MSRQPKHPQLPTQYKHLRFADIETGEILNFGGFSLAYRLRQQPSEVAGRPNIGVEYAYSECSIHDNFDKRDGRNRTFNRLAHKAPDFYEEFDLTPYLPEGYEHHIINLGEGVIDLAHGDLAFNLQETVVKRFLDVYRAILNVGTEEDGEGNLTQNLFVTEAGHLAINSEVLGYVEPSFEVVAHDVAVTVVQLADEALDSLDNFEITSQGSPNSLLVESVRKTLSDIKDLCSTMIAASGETGDEEESDEDDGPTIDTDEDDGGIDGDEDDIEGDDDEDGEETRDDEEDHNPH